MVFLKDKQAIGYPVLMVVVVIILLGLLAVEYVSPSNRIADNIDYGKSITDVNMIFSNVPAAEFFLKENIANTLDKAKSDFSRSLGLTSEQLINRAGSGCKVGSLDLWYNQKNIDKSATVALPKDKITSTNAISNTGKIDIKKLSCIPNFEDNFDSALESQMQSELENSLSSGLGPVKSYDPQISIKPDSLTGVFDVNVKATFNINGRIADITKKLNYDYKYDVGTYKQLLLTLEKTIPLISENAKTDVPSCIKDIGSKNIDNPQLYCIKKTIFNLIKKNSVGDLFKTYDFNITYMKNFNDKKYYGLQFNVSNKVTNSNVLIFGIILENNIPNNLVNFKVESFKLAENMVSVNINEPKFSKNIESYVILYSYDNFFDKNSYPQYDKLMGMLKKSQIPNSLQTGINDEFGNYYHSTSQSGLDMNILVSNTDNFVKNAEGEPNTKQILLYQIYDTKSKKYVLLQHSKPLYVFVFGVDSNNNFYVKNLEGQTKSAVVKNPFGPLPLVNNNDPNIPTTIKMSSDISGVKDSFSFSTMNYNEKNFDHFDVYIMQNRKDDALVKGCKGVSFGCYYIDGSGVLTKENGNYLITSQASLEKMKGFDKVVNVGNKIIKSAQEYEVLVVPVDSSGNGILNSAFMEYSTKSNNGYYILNDEKLRLLPKYFTIIPANHKAPNPMSSIQLLNNKLVAGSDGFLYLQWKAVDTSVEYLQVRYSIIDSKGETLRQDVVKVQKDGKLIQNSAGIKVVVDKIIPVDSFGNQEDIQTYSSQTYTASYP